MSDPDAESFFGFAAWREGSPQALVAAEGQKAVQEWYELNPPMLVLGRSYTTRDGRQVTMVSLANPGTEHESMADQHGHHRYSRSHDRIIGRCTGSPNYDPGNIVFATPTASMANAAEPVAVVLNRVSDGKTHKGASLHQNGLDLPVGTLLYATPGPRGENAGGVVELTDEAVNAAWEQALADKDAASSLDAFAKLIQRACATAWGLRIAEKGDAS